MFDIRIIEERGKKVVELKPTNTWGVPITLTANEVDRLIVKLREAANTCNRYNKPKNAFGSH